VPKCDPKKAIGLINALGFGIGKGFEIGKGWFRYILFIT